MAVMAREAWTDERLDDLARRMDKGFDEVKGEIRDLRMEMNAMLRTMIIGFVTTIVTVVASVLGGILVTQL
jgi:hypothetical protein